MTILESLDIQALSLAKNPSQRAKEDLHALKTVATWLYIAQTRKALESKAKGLQQGGTP